MAEVAFLFPGQGSQYVGMGKGLNDEFSEAKSVFEEANDALGFSLSRLCFEGPEEELRLTQNTQPALLTVSVAAHRILRGLSYEAAIVAGHSLGEYAALEAAGAIEFQDAVRLVRKRGQYMQEAVPAGLGSMAALLKLPEGALDDILRRASRDGQIVTAANYNSPDQIVIAGHAQAVATAMELAKEAGAKRAIALAVSAPFHCPLMKPAQERLAQDFEAITFHELQVPLVNNWQAAKISTADEAKNGLLEQIPNPVRWTDSIRRIAQEGIEQFVEVGAGTVLTGLCRTIDPTLRGAKFGEPADLQKVKELLG